MINKASKLVIALLIGLISGCQQKICDCSVPPSPLAGDWKLTAITSDFITPRSVTPAEAGYTESLSFIANSDLGGSYRQMRNGIPIRTSEYAIALSTGRSTEGTILFKADTTQQSFRIATNKLYLSERTPKGLTIADGSTYEYQR